MMGAFTAPGLRVTAGIKKDAVTIIILVIIFPAQLSLIFHSFQAAFYEQNAYHLTFLKHRFDFDHISILICMTQK